MVARWSRRSSLDDVAAALVLAAGVFHAGPGPA